MSVCLSVCPCVYMPECVCYGQRTTFRSSRGCFSHSSMLVPEMKLKIVRIGGKCLYPPKYLALMGPFLSQQVPWFLPTLLSDLEQGPDTPVCPQCSLGIHCVARLEEALCWENQLLVQSRQWRNENPHLASSPLRGITGSQSQKSSGKRGGWGKEAPILHPV